jgi:hypothetical protein
MESITDEIDSLSMHTAEIDITQKREVQKLDETKFEVGKISEKVEEISAEHMITVERVKSFQWKVWFYHSHLNHILLVCAGRCYCVGSVL